MAMSKLFKAGAAFAATGAFALGAAGAANAAGTIQVPVGHTDVVEIVCELDASGNPQYEIGSHLSGIGDVPNATTVLSDYIFTFDKSDDPAWITKSGSWWTVSGDPLAEPDIVYAGFHYEPASSKCAKTVTIDLKNGPGSSSSNEVNFTSNAPAVAGHLNNGTTSTQDTKVVTLGNPHVSTNKYDEHIHGAWKFYSAVGKTFPLAFDVTVAGQPTVTVQTANFRVQN